MKWDSALIEINEPFHRKLQCGEPFTVFECWIEIPQHDSGQGAGSQAQGGEDNK